MADFGIALAASKAGGARMTETGMSLGTPHYMSPEQAMGEREITARSDVYALGACSTRCSSASRRSPDADRYRLERELGEGGMATVYLAQDLKHDRKVAVKVLRPELAAVIGAERFLSEIKTTANLQHPHILPLFDSGEADSFLFYVMPYVQGETVRDRIAREKQLPVADAVRIATEVAAALDYAHRHGVIHRDIKPENILLHDGSALVADFGIALAASKAGGARMTETGMSLGTPHYMSPEQAMGEREITARSDVYALGCVLYEMLLGEPPFTGPTAQSIVAKVMTAEPAALSPQRKSIPPVVEDAVLTALEKLPADRFATAAEFAAALAGHAGSMTGRSTTAARVRPRRAVSNLPLLLALLVAAILAGLGWWRAGRSATPEVTRFQLLPAPGTRLEFPSAGIATYLALSPDGRQAAYVASRGRAGWELYVRSMDQLSAQALPGTEGAAFPEFSPDGKWIAFGAPDGTLKKIRVDGTNLTTLCQFDAGGLSGLTWLSDDELAFTRENLRARGLWRVPSDGGDPVQFSQFDSASGERLQLAPRAADRGRLVFYSSTRASTLDLKIGVISAKDGNPKVFAGLRGVRVLGLVDGFLIYVRADGALMAAPFDVGALEAGPPLQILDNIAARYWLSPAALSASGDLLYQRGGLASQLVSVDQHGAARPLLDSARVYMHPRLSPDGRRVAFEAQSGASNEIWIADLAGQTAQRMTREGFSDRPEWTPDGRRLMYVAAPKPANSLWWQPADGSGTAELVYQGPDAIREGVFTPDGQSVAVPDGHTRQQPRHLPAAARGRPEARPAPDQHR